MFMQSSTVKFHINWVVITNKSQAQTQDGVLCSINEIEIFQSQTATF